MRELVLARQFYPLYINTRNHVVNLRFRQGRLDDAEAEIRQFGLSKDGGIHRQFMLGIVQTAHGLPIASVGSDAGAGAPSSIARTQGGRQPRAHSRVADHGPASDGPCHPMSPHVTSGIPVDAG